MRIAKEIAASRREGRHLRKAIWQEEPRGDATLKPEFMSGARASGTCDWRIEFLGRPREVGGLLVQPQPRACYALIAYRTLSRPTSGE